MRGLGCCGGRLDLLRSLRSLRRCAALRIDKLLMHGMIMVTIIYIIDIHYIIIIITSNYAILFILLFLLCARLRRLRKLRKLRKTMSVFRVFRFLLNRLFEPDARLVGHAVFMSALVNTGFSLSPIQFTTQFFPCIYERFPIFFLNFAAIITIGWNLRLPTIPPTTKKKKEP